MEAPSIPDYYREEILDMKPELVPLFLNVLGLPTGSNERQRILADLERRGKIKPRMAIPVAGGLQFGDLPPELQVGILGRVSPTAREGAFVSRGVKELADVALMDNIRSNNLVDPTIGVPERNEYFKFDTEGHAKYFSPEPALWRSFKRLRTEDIASQRYLLQPYQSINPAIPVLIYGTYYGRILFNRFTGAETHTSVYPNKFVSLAVYVDDGGRTPSLKFMTIKSSDDPRVLNLSMGPRLPHQKAMFIYLNNPPIELLATSTKQLITEIKAGTLTISELRNARIVWHLKDPDNDIRTKGMDAKIRIIPLNTRELEEAELILPSLRYNVKTI